MLNRRQVAWFVIGVAIAAVVLVVIGGVFVAANKSTLIRGDQVDNTTTLDASAETLQIIKGCTTPGESCYERGQSQVANAVTDINKVVILAAACAANNDDHPTVEQIQRCVVRRLAKEGKR